MSRLTLLSMLSGFPGSVALQYPSLRSSDEAGAEEFRQTTPFPFQILSCAGTASLATGATGVTAPRKGVKATPAEHAL